MRTQSARRIGLTRVTGVVLGSLLLVGFSAGPVSALGASPATSPPAAGPVGRPSYADQLGAQGPTVWAARASSVMPHQPYTDWSWPGKGYTSTTETLTVTRADPGSRYFWAYDFAVGGSGVGYVGLQSGSHPSLGKIGLFAIWGADAAIGPHCGAFDGEGEGWTCRLDPFPWALGRSYALRIAVVGGDATGTWYIATVRDLASNAVHTIGRIHHPSPEGDVTGRGSWTEWFGGPSATCDALKRSKVRWGRPVSNGTVKASGHWNHSEPKDGAKVCSGYTSIADDNDAVWQSVGPK